MIEAVALVFRFLISTLASSKRLHLENLALRHQIRVLQRSVKRPNLKPADRILWSLLSRAWPGWRDALAIVKPETVIKWQRRRFKDHWANLSKPGPGRPSIAKEIQELIRTMSSMNITWGSPRIVGELAKLGIEISKCAVEKYMVRSRKPPSQGWRAFLKNHASEIVSIDFLVVPTVRFNILYVMVFLSIERRRILHFNVSAHPTATWAGQQVAEAFPWDSVPRFLLRDRDGIYGERFRSQVAAMGVKEVLTAPRSPWQNPYSERLNGSIRRECLDHIIVFNQGHLRRVLSSYVVYDNRSRTHLSLKMDTPERREVQSIGKVISIPEVGGLHHRYEREAA